MIGEHFFWLGLNPVQPRSNRVALPELAREALFDTADPANWGFDTDDSRVLLSKLERFDAFDELRFTESTTVQENGVVVIPKQFFPDYEGKAKFSQPVPEDLRFDYGETLHFLTTEILLRHTMCYVLNDMDGRDIVNGELPDIALDGGRRLDADQEEPVIPEAVVAADEAYYVNEQRPVSLEEMFDIVDELDTEE